MLQTSTAFKENASGAMENAGLQKALAHARPQFTGRRRPRWTRLPEFEALREEAKNIKNHAIANLDFYLETYAAAVEASGGVVHWCSTAEDARQAVLKICRAAGAKTVTKGKSMVTEEIALNDFLEDHGITPVETDLGEYILQLRAESPSHIIAPAFHLNREDWEESFRKSHTDLPPERVFRERRDILTEARGKLREKFLAADVGITGANFLIAETGSSVIVTNEGNGDLTQTLPRVHVVVTSIEKVVPTIEDALSLIRVLARSATGQDMSVYTTFSTGGRRVGDPDGPEEYHVVLVDNGRSGMVGTEFQDMLRCIRCAACMNHCPVYGAVGGHAYGGTYPGPMGAVLTPMLVGDGECRASAECEHVLRQMRERVPGEDPAAEFDAPLARARVRAASDAADDALRAGGLGVFRAPAGIVPDGHAGGGLGAWAARRQARGVCPPAFGRGVDARAGFSGPRGRYVLRAIRGPAEREKLMSRQAIIGAIQRGLKRGPLPVDQRDMLAGRIAAHPRHLVPARGQLDAAGRVALFAEYVEREFGTVARLASLAEVPGAIAEYLAQQNLAPALAVSPHPESGAHCLLRTGHC